MQLKIPQKEPLEGEKRFSAKRIIIPRKEESMAAVFKNVIFSFKIIEEKTTIIIGQR